MQTVRDFIFLASKITSDSDCSHEIKRCLEEKPWWTETAYLKAETSLPTKVHIAKAMVFAVVMGCENWTIEKTECQRIDAFEVWSWGRLESSLDSKEIKPVNPKGNQPEYSLEGPMLKLQFFGHLLWRAYSMEKTPLLGKTEGRRRRGWQRMRRLDGIINSVDMSLSKLQKIV